MSSLAWLRSTSASVGHRFGPAAARYPWPDCSARWSRTRLEEHPGMVGVPGKNMPNFVTVERDYGALYDMYTTVGPLFDKLGATTKFITYDLKDEVAKMAKEFGVMVPVGRRPSCTGYRREDCRINPDDFRYFNGEVAVKGFKGA